MILAPNGHIIEDLQSLTVKDVQQIHRFAVTTIDYTHELDRETVDELH